jgi:DNA ligase-1
MVSWVAAFIQRLEEGEVEPAVAMLLGKVLPRKLRNTLEVRWRTIANTIHRIAVVNDGTFSKAFSKTGDLGGATKLVLEAARVQKQVKLLGRPLTILEVRHTFEAIAEIKGAGSREKKERLLEALLGNATPLEAKYLVKIIIGEMRTGFHEGLMEMAVAQAYAVAVEKVQTADMLLGDLGEVAFLARKEGESGLAALRLQVFRPIKPMLAQMGTSVAEVLKEHGGVSALEYKLDGARIQIHKSGDTVRIFSRRLTDVTESLPETTDAVRRTVKSTHAILEGEVVAVDQDGAPLPFQHLMRRFKRVRGVAQAAEAIPVQLYLFDALYVDGGSLINETYEKRREALAKIAGSLELTPQVVVRDAPLGEAFLQKAVAAGHEGVMVKKLDSPYTPGIRGKKWFKIKQILEPLDLVIVAAEYGYGRRRRWLSDYYLGARDANTGELLTVGKTFKGLTDAEIVAMTRRLKELAIGVDGHRVRVAPAVVVEVAYNEIQASPKYRSGMALRFARITRIRPDKDVAEADTIQRLRSIYEKQFEKKGRLARIP